MTDLFETITAIETNDMPFLPVPEPTAAHIPRARTHLPAVNILALDLATTCGWAYSTRNGTIRSGREKFSAGRNPHAGYRWVLMRTWLNDVSREVGGFQTVYFEEVKQRFVSNLAARAYCGYLAILEAWCAANNVPMVGVGVGTVKKHWTGFGNADKDAMVIEARRRGFNPRDDNEADALAILSYAVKEEA